MQEIREVNAVMKNGESRGQKRKARTHPKLPSGFGTVRFLGEGRSKPYAVHPSAKRMDAGFAGETRPPAICYVPNWHVGVAVLMAWNAGTYTPGLETQIEIEATSGAGANLTEKEMDTFCRRCLDYVKAISAGDGSHTVKACDQKVIEEDRDIKLGEIYEMFYERKFGSKAPKKMAKATADNTRRVAKKLEPLFDRNPDELTIDELQSLVNSIGHGKTMVSKVIVLIKQLYKFALSRELCTRNPSQYIITPDTLDHVHHQDFTDEELRVLWMHQGNPVVDMILIMCYSGFRISEFHSMETNLEDNYFRGGIKTEAGTNRIVPIHSGILPIVRKTINCGTGYLMGLQNGAFSIHMKQAMADLGIDVDERHHTPHSCRHTFSRLCESYGVREADRKRMLGHSFGSDITNDVYGHRTLEELRREIEKIHI